MLDLNFSSCRILFGICILLITIIVILIYRTNNNVFILEEDQSTLIKKSPTTLVINMEKPETPDPIEYVFNNINPFDEQILNLHKPDIKIGDNIINKQEFENEVMDECEVEKNKPYTPLVAQKKVKLSKINCNLGESNI